MECRSNTGLAIKKWLIVVFPRILLKQLKPSDYLSVFFPKRLSQSEKHRTSTVAFHNGLFWATLCWGLFLEGPEKFLEPRKP